MKRQERLDLAQWVTDQAKKAGADEVAVSISNNREIEIEYRDKKLETLQESSERSLSLDIYVDQRYSGHSTNDLRQDKLRTFIEEAVASTRYLTQDEYRALPDPKFYPQKTDGDLNLRDAFYNKVESDERVKIAAAVEEAAMAQSDKIISASSSYSDVFYERVLAHSNGFLGESSGTVFSSGAEVTVKDEDARPEDWSYGRTRFYHELPTPDVLGQDAARRALQKLGQKKIESGKYDMIVENRAASRLLYMLYSCMTGWALQQKRTWMDGKVGQQVASDKLTIIDDPFIEKGFGSHYFDGEGLAAKRRVMIDKGVLQHYYIDNYYAKKLDMAPTSGGSSNILFTYGDRSFDDMVKDLERGLVVTGFIGGNSNSTTGDFSFGIVGLLVEKGDVVHAINEMNVSGNAKDFWKQLVEVGNDPYPYSSWQRPTLRFEGIDFSGI